MQSLIHNGLMRIMPLLHSVHGWYEQKLEEFRAKEKILSSLKRNAKCDHAL